MHAAPKRLPRRFTKRNQTGIRILHARSPGRVRIEVHRIYRDTIVAAWLESELARHRGVKRASANPLTASVLIEFKAKLHTPTNVVRLAERAVKHLPKELRHHRKGVSGKAPPLSRAWHAIAAKSAVKMLGSSPTRGLDVEVVSAKRKSYGVNTLLNGAASRSDIRIFSDQFRSLPVALLGVSALLSTASGGFADATAILAMTLLNGYIGYVTERSSERITHSLLSDASPRATVVRSGRAAVVDARELVVGDLILLRHGDVVPADARLLSVRHLTVDESILTGESVPVLKCSSTLRSGERTLGDRNNLVYRGTAITGGDGTAVVVAVGAHTEIGKIQALMAELERPRTPMQAQLSSLGNQLALLSFSASGLLLLIGISRRRPLIEIVRSSISLAVAAIPESLPTISTTTLARGVRNLKDHKIIVRRLDAVETLASVDVLCLDKTGTLTINRMEVTQVSASEDRSGKPAIKRLAKAAVLCNDASENDGSPTETALLHFACREGIDIVRLRAAYPRQETQYRSERKRYMRTAHHPRGRSSYYIAVKGDPVEVLSLCRTQSAQGRMTVMRENERMARAGLRVLGFASGSSKDRLEWLGMVGMADPIREGMRELVPRIHAAGIETAMITGDQPATATAIARQLGIKNVFARVSPARKLEIISQLQRSGKVVAMIGDGVNDGPALRAADVGVAMAQRGAETAAKAAGIILPEDNIERMLVAVREGRLIQRDVQKAVNYILAQNSSEVLFALIASAFTSTELLTPMQFLWINFVTDIFPELALAREPAESDLLSRPPIALHERLLSKRDLLEIFSDSSFLAAAPLATSLLARANPEKARSLAFVSLIGASLFYTFSRRSSQCTIFDGGASIPPNPYVPLAVGAGFLAELAGVTLPRLKRLLSIGPLSTPEILATTTGALLPLFGIEFAKFVRKQLERQNTKEELSWDSQALVQDSR